MRIILCENYQEMSNRAAAMVASQVMIKPDCVLGLATGSTPIGMYDRLGQMCQQGEVDFSAVTSFNLDEYYPIKKENDQSYDYFMKKNLFSKINIDLAKTHIPNGEAEDPLAECENYEKMMKASGGIDLQILGIGQNGHIGFNEPDASLNSFTHLTGLTENTIKANSRFFEKEEDVPRQALTMGISSILRAKKIILLASGANKNRVVNALLDGEINTHIPATLLKIHNDVTLICDRDAFGGTRLGVDIGGTNIKFAVVDGKKVLHKSQIKTAATAEQIIEDITAEVKKLIAEHNVKNVGIGTPGIVKDGKVTCVNLPFKDTPLEREIASRVDVAVTVDNDANCAALGEVNFGAIVINRQICRNNNNMGELGHMIVQTEGGRSCPCGQEGCLEQYCSMTALIQDAVEGAQANPESELHRLYAANNKVMNGEVIFAALEKECPVAAAVYDRFLNYLARGIESYANIFGPDAVVLAGGVTVQGDKLLKPLKVKLKKEVRIEISTLQNDAGALGAALL